MSEKQKLENTLGFNYFALFFGLLCFIILYFLFDSSFLLSFLVTMTPIISGAVNIFKIKEKEKK
ncbi:hypothetical protein [Staphylococcus hominis]|uniref:hypothetical protein n=1 Tax=Staphylococcus hominis TaxID=1290 RepID=UPI00066B2935|nr:hypothetical protein [Staphylococcus hominis]NAM96307.1 hypothetical protein [Staphylococcus hominis]TRL61490.1 hypothetical protein FNL08_10690 [Staphylococcus hominis]CVY72868.1 Uncharacterised protein [Staphylococcus hominis]